MFSLLDNIEIYDRADKGISVLFFPALKAVEVAKSIFQGRSSISISKQSLGVGSYGEMSKGSVNGVPCSF